MKTTILTLLMLVCTNIYGIDKKLITVAKNHLKLHEGYREKSYICPGGMPTIGYGHQLRKGENIKKLSKRHADNLLERDIRIRFIRIKKKFKLNDRKTMALTLFSFNLGIGRLYRSTMAKLKFEQSSLYDNWTVYCKVKGKVHKTLKKRRIFEYNMFTSDAKLNSVIILKKKDNGSDSSSTGTITKSGKCKEFYNSKYFQSKDLFQFSSNLHLC